MKPVLHVDNVSSQYGDTPVLNGVSFALYSGEIGCLLGPSGCGKTTLLRAIAGFQPITSGAIILNDRTLSADHTALAPEQRSVGMIFQDYALFPHLTVRKNIEFGIDKLPLSERSQRCDELLHLVRLSHLSERYPFELSGGQQQRVAVARALAPQPDMLLMDEPFSSLDVELRKSLALEIRRILKELGISAMMVTHDQTEAFAVADKIGVLQHGVLQQWDSPFDLYHEPDNRFVADFVGGGVFIPAATHDAMSVITELGMITGHRSHNWPAEQKMDVLLRPDDVLLDEDSPYQAEVASKLFAGTSTLYTLKLSSGNEIQSMFPSHHDFTVGDTVGIRVEADHLIAFEPTTERASDA
jgi:iron(III) transport system ATP-binding protein